MQEFGMDDIPGVIEFNDVGDDLGIGLLSNTNKAPTSLLNG